MLRHVMAGALLVVTAAPAGAQTVVTESEFLSVLGPDHPAVVQAAEDLAIARASHVDVSAFENPALEVVREDPGPASQTDLMLSWQLPDASRGLEIKAAEHRVRSAEATLAQAILSLRLEMREIYAQWAIAAAREGRLGAQLERIDALARRGQVRAKRGETSGLEAHLLQLAAHSLAARLALATADEAEARARIMSWNPRIAGDARPVLPELSAHQKLNDPHPLVFAAEAELAAARAARNAARRFIRSPELMGGWQRQQDGGESLDGPLLGLRWSIPLFRRNQAETLIADARLRAAAAKLEHVQREIGAHREAAVARYTSLASSIARLELTSAENDRMLRGAEAAFLAGEATVTEFLETLRSATEAELTLLELSDAALAALRDLQRFQGPGDAKPPMLIE
ncbi:MAG TPA: TolC family protein [Thermoanaerobaculia bacterium]|nr:TolC family protein [Thermoanaerobaculia bacterium]